MPVSRSPVAGLNGAWHMPQLFKVSIRQLFGSSWRRMVGTTVGSAHSIRPFSEAECFVAVGYWKISGGLRSERIRNNSFYGVRCL